MASLIGKEIGKYRITERLGQGGMAEVYAGVHTHLDRKVAVKVLHSYLLEGGDFVARFKREAKSVANLRHPNIVQVFDFDIQDDLIFMVMEYVDGVNLHTKLVEVGNKGERMPIKLIGSIINDIASALDYAHTKGMLHRDIKPSNIMLDSENKAYLTDFGIAKLLSDQKFTATGTLVGTPAYMSPEQGLGDDVSKESDIYSLGVVAFEMLTGQVPYDAKTPIGIVHKQINDPVPNMGELVDGVPGSAQEVINRALAKAPESRFSSAEDLVSALRTALQALESTDSISVPAEESPTMVDDGLEAPTVTMKAEEMEQATVVMEVEAKKEEPPAKEPKKKDPKQIRTPKPIGEMKKIPLWAYIAGGVGVLAIAAILLTQVFDINLLGSTGGVSSDTIEISVHASEGTNGLSLVPGGDGDIEYITIDGLAVWRTGNGNPLPGDNDIPDNYLYFQIDDNVMSQLPEGSQVYIDVELLNQDRDTLYIQYDAHDPEDSGNGFFKETQAVAKSDTGEFTVIRFELTNAFFGNRTHGSDFRINDNSDGAEVVRSVKVIYSPAESTGESPDQGFSAEGEELLIQGVEHFDEGRYEEALVVFEQALESGNESPELFNYLGRSHRFLGNHEAALENFTRAIELDESSAWYWFNRGRTKLEMGDIYGAIDDIYVAVEIDPESWLFLHTLGEAYYYSGDQSLSDEAHYAFDRAIVIQPDNSYSYQVLGEMLWFLNHDLEAALGWLNIAIEKAEPGDPGPYHLRGVIFKETGQFELCIPDFNEFVNRDPENPWAYFERGDCYSGLGDTDMARNDFERFITLAEGNPDFVDQINRAEDWLQEN